MKNKKITYSILGTKSKIAQSLKKQIPKDWEMGDKDVDVLFVTNKKEYKIKAKHIIDLTSRSKVEESSDYSYAFEYGYYSKNNLSNPGCSALAAIYALYPIQKYLESVELFAYFPLSALKHNSPNRDHALREGEFLLEREHYHKKEIENLINQEIEFRTIICSRENILKLAIHISSTKSIEELEVILANFYQDNKSVKLVKELDFQEIKEKEVHIQVKQETRGIVINVLIDNINYLAFNSIREVEKLVKPQT